MADCKNYCNQQRKPESTMLRQQVARHHAQEYAKRVPKRRVYFFKNHVNNHPMELSRRCRLQPSLSNTAIYNSPQVGSSLPPFYDHTSNSPTTIGLKRQPKAPLGSQPWGSPCLPTPGTTPERAAPGFVVFEAWASCCRQLEIFSDTASLLPAGERTAENRVPHQESLLMPVPSCPGFENHET